jgi:hypothetical protein
VSRTVKRDGWLDERVTRTGKKRLDRGNDSRVYYKNKAKLKKTKVGRTRSQSLVGVMQERRRCICNADRIKVEERLQGSRRR